MSIKFPNPDEQIFNIFGTDIPERPPTSKYRFICGDNGEDNGRILLINNLAKDIAKHCWIPIWLKGNGSIHFDLLVKCYDIPPNFLNHHGYVNLSGFAYSSTGVDCPALALAIRSGNNITYRDFKYVIQADDPGKTMSLYDCKEAMKSTLHSLTSSDQWEMLSLKKQIRANQQFVLSNLIVIPFTLNSADEKLTTEEKKFLCDNLQPSLTQEQNRVLFDSDIPPEDREYHSNELPNTDFEDPQNGIMVSSSQCFTLAQCQWIAKIFSVREYKELGATQKVYFLRKFLSNKLPYPKWFPKCEIVERKGKTVAKVGPWPVYVDFKT